ncbi:hypothetical protein TFLX_00069 [Thermoflexales bacterium]|nr:hypothetical protein TFLX_00069 [Thermoflexales bacterium]
MSDVALTLIQHDPSGTLFDQTVRIMPRLQQVFTEIAVFANADTAPSSIEYLAQHGVRLVAETRRLGLNQVGWLRRAAVELALQGPCPFILYCDFDRILHWMEFHPQELSDVAQQIGAYDFTVLGRTPRAFATHPRIQRDTEAIINHVFERVSGWAWDTGAGARGLARRAAEAIVTGCLDDQISNDVTWPLYLAQRGGFTLGHLETEGLEFETPDRFPTEVAQAGGVAQWSEQLDDDPQHWAYRLELARIEVEAMLPYTQPGDRA